MNETEELNIIHISLNEWNWRVKHNTYFSKWMEAEELNIIHISLNEWNWRVNHNTYFSKWMKLKR